MDVFISQDALVGDESGQEATAEAQKLQKRVREAKQRAMEAKEQLENERQQTKKVKRKHSSMTVAVKWINA